MTKLVIFDLDGVLIETREFHFQSLNQSISQVDPRFIISREDHNNIYNGLNTAKKLELLTELKGLPVENHIVIKERKQNLTFEYLKTFKVDNKLINICNNLKELRCSIAVASNSIRKSVNLSLSNLGIIEYIDYSISNEDVKRPKPFPEMYWKCMSQLGYIPTDTIIVEDSLTGIKAAKDSGAHVLTVGNPSDVTWELIENKLKEIY
jgi:hypothetical protein